MQRSRLAVLIAIGGLLLPTLMTPTPAHASRARVRTLRDISGPSPFPADECGLPKGRCSKTIGQNCSTDGDCTAPSCPLCMLGETCISQHGDEYEPHIAVNPAHRRNLIAVYSQDNQIDTVVSTSRDGGRHWKQVVVGLSSCSTGGTQVGTGDPDVAIGPDGIAYTSSLVQDPSGSLGVLVNTSTDGGLSWSAPVAVDQNQPVVDGEVLAADPHHPATAYLTWTRALVQLTFSRTTDGGATWTPPAMIPVEPDPVAMTGPCCGQIRVLPDGTLVDVFIQVHAGPAGPTGVWVVRSADQGDHWSDPIRVAPDIPANVVKDPDRCSTTTSHPCSTDNDCALPGCLTCTAGETCGTGIGRGISFALPRNAVGTDGTLYAVWHLIESTSSSKIQFVKSVDGGKTWSAPAPVAVETTQAFLPTVAVSPAGTVGVTYFDFRNDVPGDAELTTDLWFRHSHDGGATWSETHVAGPFDLRTAPSPGVYPLGDYFGLAPIGRTGFGAAWVQPIGPGPEDATDTFFARLRVSPRR